MNTKVVVLIVAVATVSCKDIILSSNSAREHKIYDEKLEASPAIWRQIQNVTVNTTENEIISRIAVTDLREDKNGEANVVEGGQGNKTVTIELKSPTVLRGYEFHIEIYAAPEENRGTVPFDPTTIPKDKIPNKPFTNEGKLRFNIGEDIPAPKTIGDVSTKQPESLSSDQNVNGKRTTRDTLDAMKDSENFSKDIVKDNITHKPITKVHQDIAAPKTAAEASTKQPALPSSTIVNSDVKRIARGTLIKNFSKDTKIPEYPAEATETQSWNEEVINKSRSIFDSKKDSEISNGDLTKDKIPNKPLANDGQVRFDTAKDIGTPKTIGDVSGKQPISLPPTRLDEKNDKRTTRDTYDAKNDFKNFGKDTKIPESPVEGAEKTFMSDNTSKSTEKPLHKEEKELKSIDLEKESKNAHGTAELSAHENSTHLPILLPSAKNVSTSEKKRYSRDISKQVNPVRQQIPIPSIPDIDGDDIPPNVPISYKLSSIIGNGDSEETRLHQAQNNNNGNTNNNHRLLLSPKSETPTEKPTSQVPLSTTSQKPTTSKKSTISKRSTTSENPTTSKKSTTTDNPNSHIREFPSDKHVHLTNSDPNMQDYDSLITKDKAVTPTLPIAMALQPKDESLIRFSNSMEKTDKATIPAGNGSSSSIPVSKESEEKTEIDGDDDENYELRATPNTDKTKSGLRVASKFFS